MCISCIIDRYRGYDFAPLRRPERWPRRGWPDGGAPTAARRRELHEPTGSVGPEGPGLLLLLHPVGNRYWRRRSCPPACPLLGRSLFPDALLCSSRSRYFGLGETAVVIARLWWRELVDGELGGVRWSVGGVVFLGVWRNPCRKADTDAVTPLGAAIPS
jgi:hypothetical protein